MLEVKIQLKYNGATDEIADCRTIDSAAKILQKCSQRNLLKMSV